LGQLHVQAAAFSMNDATNWSQLLDPGILIGNCELLLSPAIVYLLLVNAGTLTAVLVLGWHRRFWPYMTLILAFLAGQAMYGNFLEFRIFMQVLPLSLILLVERWREKRTGIVSRAERAGSGGGWAVRERSSVFLSAAIAFMVLSAVFVAWRYEAVRKNQLAGGGSLPELETAGTWFKNVFADAQSKQMHGSTGNGKDSELRGVCNWFAKGYAGVELHLANELDAKGRQVEAMTHYRTILDLEAFFFDPDIKYYGWLLATANNNLAWHLATAADPRLRNGNEAVRLAARACQLTDHQAPFMMGTLAAAYAEAGRWDEAVATAQQARSMALARGQEVIAERNEQLLKLYQSRQAYHHPANPNP
jgi:hypothetical protein